MIKNKAKKRLFRVDFFRLHHNEYEKLLFLVAVKYKFNVSYLKDAVYFQMGFDLRTETATMYFLYLFSLVLLRDEISENDKKQINKTLFICNKRMSDILCDSNKYNLTYILDNGFFSFLNIKNSSDVCNKVFLVRNHNNRDFKIS